MRITIQTDIEKGTISRHIYGHFSEHLGRCIYGGFWVGEESSIPNVDGIRLDVIEALKKINIPAVRRKPQPSVMVPMTMFAGRSCGKFTK